MPENKNHVIVIGAGVAGLAVAYYLNQKGIDVTVCEKGDGKDNCSYGNAGLIAPRHVIPLSSPGVISQGLRWMLKKESPFR
ncbi:MAG TPA: FAD-dependent oxidoreductase, partial [Fodinibius sp.]|nr:FAD-dependent oxidoreductase [Fodinibius sp.]